MIYICNPITREWIGIRLEESQVSVAFGFAFYHISPSGSGPNFKLVSINRSEIDSCSYSFAIYSYETRCWKMSSQSFNCNSTIFQHRGVFVNGRIHWLTFDHHIIVFEIERDLAHIIKLPGVTPRKEIECRKGLCLGDSHDILHYVYIYDFAIKVWFLEAYDEPRWVLKHHLEFIDIIKEYPSFFPLSLLKFQMQFIDPEDVPSCETQPYLYFDEVLYLERYDIVYSYNFQTRKLEKICTFCDLDVDTENKFIGHPRVIPFSVNLMTLGSCQGNYSQVDENKSFL